LKERKKKSKNVLKITQRLVTISTVYNKKNAEMGM